ncbi:uncharacterized protein LOC127701119 [Mytilus californianus]|uniref:uncharacterized protein LOC127701119 n=1 Tax=Mytilus californianus TaxID=6549 RepID=UPI002246E5BA|nr:uncharacterized protein LOC127701119 [Mytilus californianus]
MDTNHHRVLRANHQLLINSIELSNTDVLDILQEDEIISSGECEEILSNKTKREQNAKLLYILKRRSCKDGDPYPSLLRALSNDYGFICKVLQKEDESIQRSCVVQDVSDNFTCFHCKLLKNLRPKDITHQLFEDEVLSDDDLDTINSDTTCRKQGVKKLFEVLGKSRLPQSEVVTCFVASLRNKYNYIVTQHTVNENTLYSCHCEHYVRPSLETSCTDRCANKISKLKYHSEDDISAKTGLIANQKNFETDDEDDTHCRGIRVRSSTSKIRKEKTVSSNEIQNLALVKDVPKSLPNNKKMFRLCSKLWDKLFTLREKGDWDLFHSVTKAARQKYIDNTDIQVLLYRSDMCISTFYNDNRRDAMESFDQATNLISSTSMPVWHLARLLPLKVELFTRSKQFDKASSLLKEAHQSMSNLVPCLSTGAVYFFEANYLGAILRCTQNGTRSLSIRERAKYCFLTAIKHYEQEKIFKIKSFLNQVYLFLALFVLGVDVRQIEYMSVYNVSNEDISLAEFYLNLFENSCWDESTNWSRMLFYIARSEQHKQRQNLQRSLDYLHDALTCAVKGDYLKQKEFLQCNITLAEKSIDEKQRLQAITQREQTVNEILANLEESSSDSC